MKLSQDARQALSRRGFLAASAGLIVSFRAAGQAPLAGSPAANQLDSWIAIAADGSVTAYSGKEELGQGIVTALAARLAHTRPEDDRLPFFYTMISAGGVAAGLKPGTLVIDMSSISPIATKDFAARIEAWRQRATASGLMSTPV